jgi:hypothetical protein
LIEEPINGVRKEAIAATSNAEFFISPVIFTRPLSQLLYVKYLLLKYLPRARLRGMR